ncbi:MAG: LruC domain-containing protein [Desulfobulbaceae bacterium]|nr:LruC domain-containing protein [Desulfobulbaceae bacterium]
MFVIFPNVSYSGSGGGLKSGDKIKIGTFPANTGIGWFLIPDGWNSTTQAFNKSSQIKYSVKEFNTFTSDAYRQHVILLNDANRQLVLLGFEDMSRPSGDNDFNDAIFYVSANPYTAIITDNIDQVKEAVDTDKDGVYDHQDAYPNDPERAYDQYSPAKDSYGTLAYEDLWPTKGDYDFNDLVVDYNYHLVLSANQSVVEMFAKFKIKAIGGTYKNGFGFQLSVAPDKIVSVTGADLKANYINTDGVGLESGQQLATIVVFDNGFNHMQPPAGFYTVNAQTGSPYVTPYEIEVKVTIAGSVKATNLGSSPFNPFIITDKHRGYEVHLPGNLPTSLADQSLFGTGDDATISAQSRYYKTLKNHPWAVHIPEKFDYPSEKSDITKAYLHFRDWAESAGQLYRDWYKNSNGYRNQKYIY